MYCKTESAQRFYVVRHPGLFYADDNQFQNGKESFIQKSLGPVTCRIEVEAPGFKRGVVENVKVDTFSVVTANVMLQPGSVNTQIIVEANAVQVNTESGTLSNIQIIGRFCFLRAA